MLAPRYLFLAQEGAVSLPFLLFTCLVQGAREVGFLWRGKVLVKRWLPCCPNLRRETLASLAARQKTELKGGGSRGPVKRWLQRYLAHAIS